MTRRPAIACIGSGAAIVIALAWTGAAAAQRLPETIEAGAAQSSFYIEPSFSGTTVVLFGAIDSDTGTPADLAITLQGPEKPVTVRKKETHWPFWINGPSITFERVPGFYALLSTKPTPSLASFSERKAYGIGIDTLGFARRAGEEGVPEASQNEFSDAIVRARRSSKLFTENEGPLEILGKRLFRAKLYLPAAAGPGLYRANFFLLRDGKVAAETAKVVRLEKVGIESFLSVTSSGRPWMYGFSAVALAALIGGTAALLFRRV